MSTRRMFSKRIFGSAKFLQMPLEAQALYFHSVLNADDDGVVEIYPLTRLLSTAPDVLKILLAKSFLTQLNEDQVMLVNNWNEHNKIRADRKVDSIYINLIPESVDLIEPKPRSDVKDNSKRIGGQSTVSVSKVRLGKVRVGKVSKILAEQSSAGKNSLLISELIKCFEDINPACKRMYGNKTQRQACSDLIEIYSFKKTKSVVENTLKKTNIIPYFPNITTPKQLFDKWSSLETAVEKYKNEKKQKLPKVFIS